MTSVTSVTTSLARKVKVTTGMVLAAGVLGACGGVHPGVAVVVGDTSFSMSQVDDMSVTYCELTVAQAQQDAAQQGGPAQAAPAQSARQQAVRALVINEVAKKVARDQDVTVPRSQSVFPDQQLDELVALIKPTSKANLRSVGNREVETVALQTAIGAAALGVPVAGGNDQQAQQAQQAGQEAIAKELEKTDITIDPRLGLSKAQLVQPDKAGTSRSLSVAGTSTAALEPGDLPKAQRCS